MTTDDSCMDLVVGDAPAHSVLPFLRWAGSKRKLLPHLRLFCPQHFNTYIEPFAGSACLFFELQPAASVLGDFNIDLIDTYKAVVDQPEAISSCLATLPNDGETYYRLRASTTEPLNSLERAVRFIYLNRYCFNGVFRTNRKGHFNVPRGSKTGKLPTVEELVACSRVLKNTQLLGADFETSISVVAKGDFVYLDPPYSHSAERNRGEYGYGAFSSNDLNRLCEGLKTIDERGATFLLSYRYSKVVRWTFAAWQQRLVTVRRHVAGFSDDRRNVREMLISNKPLIPHKKTR